MPTEYYTDFNKFEKEIGKAEYEPVGVPTWGSTNNKIRAGLFKLREWLRKLDDAHVRWQIEYVWVPVGSKGRAPTTIKVNYGKDKSHEFWRAGGNASIDFPGAASG